MFDRQLPFFIFVGLPVEAPFFVIDTPDYDAGVVAVTGDHRG